MRRIWFVTNTASGSTSAAAQAAIKAAFLAVGDCLVCTTELPGGKLPDGAALDRAGADTLAIYAGDGTINAALEKVFGWTGAVLILPGGTMNLLPRALHGDADPVAIVRTPARLRALPFVEIGEHRAYVAAIIGPAAHWHRPRELVRASRFRQIARAIGVAWRASFDRGIRVRDGAGRHSRHQAVIASPRDDSLEVAGIDARRWSDVARLGWNYVTGDWLDAPSVSRWRDDQLALVGRRGILALVDGEPVQLVPPMRVCHGMSDAIFLTTLEKSP